MDVFLQNSRQKVQLTQAEFKAQGGEGAVYVQGDTAYKIYADPAKMLPMGKIRELAVLDRAEIIRPQEVLLDAGHVPIGYTMRVVPGGLVLCQTFPQAFRRRMSLTPENVGHLVQQLQEGVEFVHSQGVLIVDLNEMNFLVDPQFSQIYFIDVDSDQTKSFGATALMESVRDRHASGWNEGTDWFSFAIVSFQMFLGIHPYKGNHPAIKTLEERMCQNVSVFHPDVSLPGVCPPLSALPATYRDWYQAVLDRGERSAPPLLGGVSVYSVSAPQRTDGGDRIVFRQWREYAGTIISFARGVTVTTEAIYLDECRTAAAGADVKIGLTPGRHVVQATLRDGFVRLVDLTSECILPLTLAGEQIMTTGGRVYVKQGGSLLELSFVETAHQVWAGAKRVGAVLEQATQLFEGVALQNLLGSWYASLLPERGQCRQVKLPALDGFQAINARFESGVLMVVAVRDGQFQKFIFRFSPDYSEHDIRIIADLATYGVNFAVLDHGLCLHLRDTGELELFPSQKDAAAMKLLADPALNGNCLLLKDHNQALFAEGNCLYRMTLKG